ncbi:MAG TPA: hypothetical protein DDY32_05485 [Desulfobulbaceae bacterium]|nr:hypothetical protein [Desulfobulbaceae bacterium]
MIFLKIFLHDEREDAISRTNLGEKLKHLKAFIRGLKNNEYKVELIEIDDFSALRKTDASFDSLLKEKEIDTPPVLLIDGKLVCAGDYPSTDELADLLRIGCTNITAEDSSTCCATTCCNSPISAEGSISIDASGEKVGVSNR